MSEKVIGLCKELGKKVEEFDCNYRQQKNCRIINGKPYCNSLVNARNKALQNEANKVFKQITKQARM